MGADTKQAGHRDARDATCVRLCFVRTVVVSAWAETLSVAVKNFNKKIII